MRMKLLAAMVAVGGLLCFESSAKAQVVYTSGYGGGYYSPYVAPVFVRPAFVAPIGGYYGGYGGYNNFYNRGFGGYGGGFGYGNGFSYSNFGRSSGYSIGVVRGGIGFSSYNFGRGRRW